MNTLDCGIRVKWICYACGMRWKNKRALYAHLRFCYWYSQFKDRIEEAPFYEPTPESKQLRYYWRNKKRILAGQKAKRERDKKNPRVLPKSMR